MIKKILAIAIVAALSACSSSNNDSNSEDVNDTTDGAETTPDTGTPTDTPPGNGSTEVPDTTTPPAPPGNGEAPVPGTKAGSYIGNIGASTGPEGVFVIDNDNRLAGLVINENGSALSVFGNIGTGDTYTGALRQYIHQESRPDATAGVFGSVAGRGANDLEIDINIVDGQTITSTETSPTAVNLRVTQGSEVTDVNAQSLAGSWTAVHSFCGADITNCSTLTTQMTFNGASVTGSTEVNDGGPVPITGAITEFGEAALINFSWGSVTGFSGIVFFNPANDGRLVFVGELFDEDDTNPNTISALLTQQ